MSTLKTHNLQSPDAGSVNIALTPNAGMVVAGVTTVTGTGTNGLLKVERASVLDYIFKHNQHLVYLEQLVIII